MLFIDDLLLAPITGFKFILRTVQRIAEEQYTDDAPVKERLLELQVLLDSREITEDEYVEREGEILRELRAIENRKRELAGVAPEEGRGPLSG
ncbi:MAG: gas vesicle protein GvpG, partial [Terriglobales bacterium]